MLWLGRHREHQTIASGRGPGFHDALFERGAQNSGVCPAKQLFIERAFGVSRRWGQFAVTIAVTITVEWILPIISPIAIKTALLVFKAATFVFKLSPFLIELAPCIIDGATLIAQCAPVLINAAPKPRIIIGIARRAPIVDVPVDQNNAADNPSANQGGFRARKAAMAAVKAASARTIESPPAKSGAVIARPAKARANMPATHAAARPIEARVSAPTELMTIGGALIVKAVRPCLVNRVSSPAMTPRALIGSGSRWRQHHKASEQRSDA